eukprot:CAMPEP_0198282556 /NCGR_PEP_ID=MMETSP1449-20131203/2341_1 /TAXON_ID=420275 /ORGANISM="Attheya septentrionalis, Strain CCMP2084" /LENGTH=369 /DNA_ID=CAMNT_0043978833 /DNA_START=199 /DNA_END=1308 /DNA_ORIENTATION=+
MLSEKDSSCDESSIDSADEALCEMLGITSLDIPGVGDENDDEPHNNAVRANAIPICPSEDEMEPALLRLREEYASTGVCVFPTELSLQGSTMRRLADELIWDNNDNKYPSVQRSYEGIQVQKKATGEIYTRRTLTRLENLLEHPEWESLCQHYMAPLVSALLKTKMALLKEKLNIKPPGGSGFAPHLDSPSLQMAFNSFGESKEAFNQCPESFVTVMVAIDNMTVENGCLMVCKGPWSEQNHCHVIAPEVDKNGVLNPDGKGRAGAIPVEVAAQQHYEPLAIKGGSVVVFSGYMPHRSAANKSAFSRRAVFLTYNPMNQGDFRQFYYDKMKDMRNSFRDNSQQSQQQRQVPLSQDEQWELDALKSIPKI